jgi:hypothetical protein
VHYVQTGATGNNVAITRLAVRNNPYSAHDREIYAEVTNFSSVPWKFQFEMALEGASLMRQDVELGAHERKGFASDAPVGRAGVIRASIDVNDDLKTDNQAFAVLGSASIAVLLVTEGNVFLEKALEVNPEIRTTVTSPSACSAEEFQKPYDAVILDGSSPKPLPPGNYFLIGPPARDGARGQALHGIRDLVLTHPGHEITAFMDLSQVTVDAAFPLEVPQSGVALVEGAGKPLLVASDDGASRTVTLGFDVRASNLPLTVSFPVLVSNVIHWLSPGSGDAGNQVAAGTPLHRRLPALIKERNITITTPQNRVVQGSIADGILSFAETDVTGIYSIRSGGYADKFAVNLSSDAESNIQPVSKAPNGYARIPMPAALVRNRSETWRYLLFLALVISILECFATY